MTVKEQWTRRRKIWGGVSYIPSSCFSRLPVYWVICFALRTAKLGWMDWKGKVFQVLVLWFGLWLQIMWRETGHELTISWQIQVLDSHDLRIWPRICTELRASVKSLVWNWFGIGAAVWHPGEWTSWSERLDRAGESEFAHQSPPADCCSCLWWWLQFLDDGKWWCRLQNRSRQTISVSSVSTRTTQGIFSAEIMRGSFVFARQRFWLRYIVDFESQVGPLHACQGRIILSCTFEVPKCSRSFTVAVGCERSWSGNKPNLASH